MFHELKSRVSGPSVKYQESYEPKRGAGSEGKRQTRFGYSNKLVPPPRFYSFLCILYHTHHTRTEREEKHKLRPRPARTNRIESTMTKAKDQPDATNTTTARRSTRERQSVPMGEFMFIHRERYRRWRPRRRESQLFGPDASPFPSGLRETGSTEERVHC